MGLAIGVFLALAFLQMGGDPMELGYTCLIRTC